MKRAVTTILDLLVVGFIKIFAGQDAAMGWWEKFHATNEEEA